MKKVVVGILAVIGTLAILATVAFAGLALLSAMSQPQGIWPGLGTVAGKPARQQQIGNRAGIYLQERRLTMIDEAKQANNRYD